MKLNYFKGSFRLGVILLMPLCLFFIFFNWNVPNKLYAQNIEITEEFKSSLIPIKPPSLFSTPKYKFKIAKTGDRIGKVSICNYYFDNCSNKVLAEAVNKLIDENDGIDFNGGTIVQNKFLDKFHWDPDGYSIVPGMSERIIYFLEFFTLLTFIWLGVFGLLIPVFLAFLNLLIPEIITLIPKFLNNLRRSFKWVWRGFKV